MGFGEDLGPDGAKKGRAWGKWNVKESATGARAAERSSRNRKATVAPSGRPKVVVTSRAAGIYPRQHNMTEGRQVATIGTAPQQAGKKQVPRQEKRTQPRLSSSTAKPKPREKPAPPVAGAWRAGAGPKLSTSFKTFYDRGDIPMCIGHGAKRRVQWKCMIDSLDFHHYLPLFFEGLRETEEPYTFLAHAGVTDLLDQGAGKVLPVVPQLVLPLKKALNTKNRKTIAKVLLVLQQMVRAGPHIGEALVPYYRSLLPI